MIHNANAPSVSSLSSTDSRPPAFSGRSSRYYPSWLIIVGFDGSYLISTSWPPWVREPPTIEGKGVMFERAEVEFLLN